jgi:hypothetical protein
LKSDLNSPDSTTNGTNLSTQLHQQSAAALAPKLSRPTSSSSSSMQMHSIELNDVLQNTSAIDNSALLLSPDNNSVNSPSEQIMSATGAPGRHSSISMQSFEIDDADDVGRLNLGARAAADC